MFKIDENLPEEVAATLRELSFDAMTVREEGLLGSGDAVLLEVCLREERAMVTQDVGFVDRLRAAGRPHGGLIVLRSRRPDRAALLRLAGASARRLPRRPIRNEVWIVT